MLKRFKLYLFLLALLCFPLGARAENSDSLRTSEPALGHNNRGVELGSKERWDEAIKEHESALKEDPNNKIFKCNLSAAYLKYGDFLRAKAIKQYERAIEVNPNNQSASDNLKELMESRKGSKESETKAKIQK